MFKETAAAKKETTFAKYPPLNPIQVIEMCSATKSRTEKEAIVAAATEEFFEGVKWAYTALITFGIKDVKLTDEHDPHLSTPRTTPDATWQEFTQLMHQLKDRKLTGHAALDAIEKIRTRLDIDTWNKWYARILMKDLKCGISSTTTNKVLEKIGNHQHKVTNFGCELAAHVSSISEVFQARVTKNGVTKTVEEHGGELWAEIKLNGNRMLTFIDPEKKEVITLSREGREFLNFTQIQQELKDNIEIFEGPVVLDGEVMSKTFQSLMKQVRRKEDVDTKDCVYNVFDIIPLEEFGEGLGKTPLRARNVAKSRFTAAITDRALKFVHVIKTHVFDLSDPVSKDAIERLRSNAIASGFEGLVFKNPDATYVTERTTDWLAYKPTLTVTLEITDFYEGEGEFVGTLGGVIAKGEEDGKKIEVRVGSGFKKLQRDDIWKNREAVKGQLFEALCDEITKAEDSETWSLRFPRFKAFRGFRKGEKI